VAKLALLGGEPIRDLKKNPYPSYPKITEEEIEAVVEVMKSGHLSSLRGEYTRRFEEEFAKYIGVNYAIACSSGSAALHLALAAVGVGPGDEVIVPAYTFTSTATAVLMQCAVPIFADVNPETYTIDVEDLEKKISDKTKAIIVVHLFGHPCEMDEIMRIAEEHGLYIIEDCAQAHGAEYKGRKVGSIGNVGCFSFYESKNMMTGEGGMVVTNDPEIAERARMLCNHGEIRGLLDFLKKKPISEAYNMLGWNYRMTELQAAIGLVQLKKLDRMNEIRRRNAEMLIKVFEKYDCLEAPKVRPYVKHAWHLFCGKYFEEKTGISRELFVKALQTEGVPAYIGYKEPLYANPLYRHKLARGKGCPFTCLFYGKEVKYSDGLCPVTEELCYKRALWLPCHSELRKEDIEDIRKGIEKVVSNINELKNI